VNIIAVDDERYALADLENVIRKAVPGACIHCFSSPGKALDYAQYNNIDVAFLDIEMPEMTGLALALRLREKHADTNIIFTTGYCEYMGNAFSMHASGYVMKPVSQEALLNEIQNLRHTVDTVQDKRVRIQCFGNFEIFVQNTPLYFPRSKSKESLAYLVHKNGSSITSATLAAVLWEDREYNRSLRSQTQTAISQLMKTLKKAGVQDIILKGWNSIAIDKSKVSCDYYDFLAGKAEAVNAYFGEYMNNYSWAEFTAAQLERK